MTTAPDMAVMPGVAVRRSEVGSLEAMEQEPTQASALESTDTKMYQAVERDLLITNDYDAGWVRGATRVRNQVAGSTEQTGDV